MYPDDNRTSILLQTGAYEPVSWIIKNIFQLAMVFLIKVLSAKFGHHDLPAFSNFFFSILIVN